VMTRSAASRGGREQGKSPRSPPLATRWRFSPTEGHARGGLCSAPLCELRLQIRHESNTKDTKSTKRSCAVSSGMAHHNHRQDEAAAHRCQTTTWVASRQPTRLFWASCRNHRRRDIASFGNPAPRFPAKATHRFATCLSVDITDVFRRPKTRPVRGRSGRRRAKALWLQEGIVNEEAAARATPAGMAPDARTRHDSLRGCRKEGRCFALSAPSEIYASLAIALSSCVTS
jgi:hypothetical protein